MTNNWIPLHVHSHYSILDGLSKPKEIIEECITKGYGACGISDHGTAGGVIDFLAEAKKKNIKPVLGCELYISKQDASIMDNSNRKLSHLVVFAKNDKGYRNLANIVSISNQNFYYKPRIDLTRLADLAENLIVINGHPGSNLAVCLENEGYDAAVKLCEWYQSVFKENFFIEISLVDGSEETKLNADKLRSIAIKLGIKCVASCDAHYPNKNRIEDQRVLLCSSLKTTMSAVHQSLGTEEEFGLAGFFNCENFDIPSPDFMAQLHHNHPEELENSKLIVDMVEKYNILQNPTTPKFICPNGMSEKDYVTHLCREGWKKKIAGKIEESMIGTYVDRVKRELSVIQDAKLDGYFLIVQDYVNWAKNSGYLVGPGRGSAAGSLVSYLLNITEIDPIPYGLLFERFYNAGRNTAEHISMPDIDVDFPSSAKDKLLTYIKDKYGHDKVAQICNYGTLQGRSALKEVLRVHKACDHKTMNDICKRMPDKTDIAEELDEDNPSMILWTLENEPKLLAEWCRLEDNGQLVGQYSKHFEQAIRLEGTIKSVGKHAAGVVISNEPIAEKCPMIHAKDGGFVTNFEMKGVEKIGYVKFDILTTEVLDVLQECNEMLERGEV